MLLQKLAIAILKLGPIPEHVSVIMDGNRYSNAPILEVSIQLSIRRFARDLHQPTQYGHQVGFEKFLSMLQWGELLGVKQYTMFAFSIDNYNRSKQEVDFLMDLARTKLSQLAADGQFFHQHQVQVKVCGDLTYCGALANSLKEVEERTKHYTKLKLNMCFSYNFTNELQSALKQIPPGLSKQEFMTMLNDKLMIPDQPDILLRTSGETRLSNFMLMQISQKTLIYFVDRKWPEFTFWDFCKMIIFYRKYQ